MLWNKLDTSLGSRYGAYLRGGADARLLVSLVYEDDLGAIEAAGFQTVYRGGPQGYVTGEVLLSQLEQIASAPGVVRISLGRQARARLNKSVPQINARPDVWDWDDAQSQFVPATGKGTGKGVLIGIIDTGIDWRHPFFLKETEPIKVTRIRAIWDQGLLPDSDEVAAGPPDASLLSTEAGLGVTYGIEYDFARIQAAINNGPTIRHRDCFGHGTHVASIAAGNGGSDRMYVGVAPEAELIVVKTLALLNETPRANNLPTGAEISAEVRFRDAVQYILKKAALAGKPVVINVSLGSSFGPHDGFTTAEDWLTTTFNAKSGICFVTAAGNDANQNLHAIIEFTGAGTVDIDLDVLDTLRARKSTTSCVERSAIPETLLAEIYYPPDAGTLTFALNAKDSTGFHAGPDRDAAEVIVAFEGFEARMNHVLERQILTASGGGEVRRSRFELEMLARTDPKGENRRYREGRYTLRITAPVALTAHLWTEGGGDPALALVEATLPPAVTVSNEFLIGAYGGAANVVTVAAYDAEVLTLGTASFSSRGPLVNYSSAAPHPVPKPDIAAPGVGVHAAASKEAQPTKKLRKRTIVEDYDGTSMASPHVAGVVALMLENNPALTSTQILNILRDHGRTPLESGETEDELGQGRVDAKLAFDKALNP